MASASTNFASTKETTNYARLCRLLVDVGSQALRDAFDKIHQPVDLHKALASARPSLQSLRKKRILNPTQWGKLYPTISSSVSSENFDITLLVLLLRNICGLSPPATGWDSLPPDADTTIEANIARVKFYRNNVYGHAKQASVDEPTFDSYWKDISNALTGLGAGASYADHISKLKTECMDPDIEEHYKDLLKEWKKDEESTKDKLGDMEEILKKSKQDGESIKNKLEGMEDKIKLMVETQQSLTEKLDKITNRNEPDQDKIKLMVETQQNLKEKLDKITNRKEPDQDYDDDRFQNYGNSDDDDFHNDDDYDDDDDFRDDGYDVDSHCFDDDDGDNDYSNDSNDDDEDDVDEINFSDHDNESEFFPIVEYESNDEYDDITDYDSDEDDIY